VDQPGRREQHKAATRQALQGAALRMFERRGYAATTVRDIASAAGVTERTFFRYFPSKEDLVLGEILDLIPVLQDHVRARPADESPYTAVLGALLAITAERGVGLAIMFSGPPARFVSEPTRPAQPVLRELEDGLAVVLAERLSKNADGPAPRGAAPGGGLDGVVSDGGLDGVVSDGGLDLLALRASVLARACVAAMRGTLIAYSALPEDRRTMQAVRGLVREAFATLRQG
jgi:AcrR family transcriptional regulator